MYKSAAPPKPAPPSSVDTRRDSWGGAAAVAPPLSTDFRTHDLYFAAYLQTAGVEMTRTDRENGRVYFVFDTSIANMDELKHGWFNNSAKVPAQPYSNAIKSLKSVCHMR
jgi:hypothetical protein